ncbi:uncharacterized protein LOC107638460 isoform X4 [Arachis ipaensis]|uniref:Uncharacterized protein n=1 Tax=Arachis hypogaea TaxID=3818 RepID=A0A444ZC74_ARAHY|nr:uncharacterized protein LOC107638460 isoform X4 [Arachis ipaensis]XP_025645596.1 uncharacterized protein LOC112741015 isoform X5 [Arachis hypogaea]QHO05792.1 Protein VASCULAR ASSOCIATED DEATH 1 [Arachis hypogaea]RYR11698.1 hypothetical protein Ahy_B04g069220 [Arachis hypogaea]
MVARLSDRPHKNIFFPLLFSAQFAILTYDSPSSPSPSHRSPSTLIVTTALTIALLRRSALIVAAPPSPSSSPSFSSSSSLCSIVSEEYTCVAEADFPIKVEDFFRYFFSDDAVNFNESLHKRCGDKEDSY